MKLLSRTTLFRNVPLFSARYFTTHSTHSFSLSSDLPSQLTTQLKPNLSPKQLKSALKMYQRGLQLPPHLLATQKESLTSLPPPGALKGHSLPLRKSGGRNHHGKITMRHRGGGYKRRIRLLDTHRQDQQEWRVLRVEHDPNRSARIALIGNQTGVMKYILASEGMREGSIVSNHSAGTEGATLALSEIPLGTQIHNLECIPGRGGQLIRAAGTFGVLVGKEPAKGVATVRLPSGESKRVKLACRASIGRVGNAEWQNRVLATAGRVRRLGRRPKVRGVAMNAVDHPHGGGKGGRSKGKPSQSIWGWTCK